MNANVLQYLRRFQKRHALSHSVFALGVGLMGTLGTVPRAVAADILRGGGGGSVPGSGAPVTGLGNSQANVGLGRANATDMLARTTMALQAMRNMQAAARQAAINGPNHAASDPAHPDTLPDVPNGLGEGGLVVDPGVATNAGLWKGAVLPTQTTTPDRTTVTVIQTAQQALLNWKTFNIGKETTLKFDQSAGGASKSQWIAFNKVNDPSGNPTQILGSIEAPGQVYVINQNGIIFGGSSQVNTHTLVASALPINETLVARGLLNNADAQFLFSGLAPAASSGRAGDVIVQAGAQITAPTSAASVGGRVALVGANVTNAGTISTPDGQTILAAGLQVGFAAHSSSDASLRGLDVSIGAVVDPLSLIPAYAGTATNSGLIEAPRANVTIAGKEVRQTGVINSSTSVALNGRIDLQASYGAVTNTAYDPALLPDVPAFLYKNTGHVEIGAGSVTQILPEWTSTEKVVGTELALRSQVNISGQSVHMGAGATLLAPNALVSANAGVWDYVGGSSPRSYFVHAGGQIYLDAGAVINVAGSTDVNVPVTQNLITVQLLGSELADSPLQRNGVLRGQTITVDIRNTGTYNGKIWYGTPLADLSGYVGLIQRSVGELTIAGGTVNLNAGGSVVVQSGAEINTSGGWINYTGATLGTTKLISNGYIYDIADATPNLVYQGIYSGSANRTDLKWAVKSSIDNPITPGESYFDPGYLLGGNGGRVSITAAAAALDGSFTGRTVAGPSQRTAGPLASEFVLKFEAQELLTSVYPTYSPTPPKVTFKDGGQSLAADPFSLDGNGKPLALRADRLADVFLSPDLLAKSGFGRFQVENVDGDISVGSGVTLKSSPRGSITLVGANLDIQGSLVSPGGSLTLKALNISPSAAAAIQREANPAAPLPNAGRGVITLGSGAVLNAAGLRLDDRIGAANRLTQPLATQGGAISILGYTANLAAGSVIDVSGGLVMNAKGSPAYADAGSIDIKAGQDPTLGYVLGGRLILGSTLRGISGAAGGTIGILAPLIQVGGTALSADSVVLQSSFFQSGGFAHFKIAGLGTAGGAAGEFLPGVYIAPGTVIEPLAESYIALPQQTAGQGILTQTLRKPAGLRLPSSVQFSAPGVEGIDGKEVRGDLVFGEGAVIRTDPKSTVTLSGNTVAVLGSIYTPGGFISINGASNSYPLLFADQTQALTTVYIGSHSTLSAAGTTLLIPDAYQRRIGEVLSGGVISVSGNIVAAAGAVMDVSGASGILDLHPSAANATVPYQAPAGSVATGQLYSLATVATRVDSNGGSIVLKGGQMLATDATLRGNAGGSTAIGGSLSISSGRFYLPNVIPPVLDSNLVVKQSGLTIDAAFAGGAAAIGQALRGPGGVGMIGRGYFAADSFAQSGMDSISLNGVVQFVGAVTLNAQGFLKVAGGGVLYADNMVSLTGSSVTLGKAFVPPVRPEDRLSQLPFTDIASTYGTGKLTVNSKHLEVGTLTLQNIGMATLAADNGDLVGNGIFTIAGNLTLRAGQIYTPTASEFTVVAYDYFNGGSQRGSITIQGAGTRQLPLSAGGSLSFYASTINQQGVLRVPFGTINLGWDGTGAAPKDLLTGAALALPVTTQLTLGATSITSVSAVDPTTGKGIVIPYGVSLDGSTWIDPRGVDITAGGLPEKAIHISGANVATASGSTVDLRGGGDLLAYHWVQGNGGSADILESAGSFAVIADYQSDAAPYAPNNPLQVSTNLIRNAGPGYVNETLQVGDRIYLAGSDALAAGFYTLLPARYAVLPGAVLVTAKSDAAVGTNKMPDGASLVSGYAYNDLNGMRTIPTLAARFEVAPAAVVAKRAEYELLSANNFLKASAVRLNIAAPQLPQDSGYLLFQGTQSMSLLGRVFSQALPGADGTAVGHGASIDISAPLDIVISNAAGSSGSGVITLNSAALTAFGAESLLIGGKRNGSTLTVQSTNITVNNAGSSLEAPDLTLATTGSLTLSAGASVSSAGPLVGTATAFQVNGNGSLLRVSQSGQADVLRTGATSASGPSLVIGAGARVSGNNLILDTTSTTSLSASAVLAASRYSLSSGRISLVLSGGGALQPSPGLVLSGGLLANLQLANSLSLRSYSSIDIYGTGQVGQAASDSLTLSAGEIRGFNQGAGTVTFAAKQITLDNSISGTVASTAPVLGNGKLIFEADTLLLGANSLRVNQFAAVTLTGLGGIQVRGNGAFSTQGALNANAPLIVGERAASHGLYADGALTVQVPVNEIGDRLTVGLGVNLTLQGSSVSTNSRIIVPSGSLTIRSTNGNVTVGNRLDAGGTVQTFYDVVKYTDAGEINLSATNGSVVINPNAVVNVAAAATGGNAGSIGVSAPGGGLTNNGTLNGQPGSGGKSGSFTLDVGTLASLGALNAQLNNADFEFSRIIRVRNGNVLVDGLATAGTFRLSVDQGDIAVTGTIDASGTAGGAISLAANGNVTLRSGAILTVAGQAFDAAGKGGVVSLESGTERNGVVGTGVVDIQTGSTVNLSVASLVAGDAATAGTSAYLGQFSGKLLIRAPQNDTFTDVLVNPIQGSVIGASSILVEGYRLYDLTSSGGAITPALESTIHANSQAFLGAAGAVGNANYTSMMNRLLGAESAAGSRDALRGLVVLAPGAEIINRTGDLTLGAVNSTTTADWDLSTFRYGEKSAPGVLTLRAAGNLSFFNSLSDGFAPTLSNTDSTWLWLARLANPNSALPMNIQSWSFRLTAGADLTAADFRAVKSTAALAAGSGSLMLGKDGGTMVAGGGDSALTSSVIGAVTSVGGHGLFQVIRTGSGDIEIHAGRSVQLLNQFASIYTAGTRVADFSMGGSFDVPTPTAQAQSGGTGALGSAQQGYPALYSAAGGNVTVVAGENIERLGSSSSRELPNNWLYRRGYVYDADDVAAAALLGEVVTEGAFGKTGLGTGIGSTTWWVDFSNFFEGVGALGGGNVTMKAGRNVTNVDAVVPTNARMSKGTVANPLAANQTLLELGGGDLVVRAGNNIDAGVYYVERGNGLLYAGGQITTNATRSPGQINIATGANALLDSNTWLPTTLFVGKGGFDVKARGDVLLGPVGNPFLLPQGVNNSFWYKTYFSTYAPDSFVNVSSLGGALTLRTGAFVGGAVRPLLQAWASTQQLKTTSSSGVAQPWLRLVETDVAPFGNALSLMPPTLRATAYGGDIHLQGNLTLAPAARGTLDLLTRGAINGLQPVGLVSPSPGNLFTAWGAARINISDADPRSLPSYAAPFAYQNLVGTSQAVTTQADFLQIIDKAFKESGGTLGSQAVLETKQALHAAGLLHLQDMSPARLYAAGGDISGLTLYSPKATRVFAGRDIVDTALYLQNLGSQDVSIVASGRDIIPYNANSLLRVAANQAGNMMVESFGGMGAGALAGDIQISGPGTLEVLAGRNLDLGAGSNNTDGTGAGITSIGNARNPFLPSEGANIIAGAGIGASAGLSDSKLDFAKFINDFVLGPNSAAYLKEVSANPAAPLTAAAFALLPPEEQKRLALEIFYLVLRDSGRDHNKPDSPGYRNYDAGKAAIAALFPGDAWSGDIMTQARDIRTKSGGDILLFAPGGSLTLATTVIGSPLAPPGIITDAGGSISIFTHASVNLGISRVFTLRGGNEIIWSSTGDIAAGSSSKTVQAAPPTRVIIDPQSADVATDLAGLATGGGIGVLASVKGVAPGDVDLIAPEGTIDAGDAGIRSTGNFNAAANQVLNAGNIQVGGTSAGTPVAVSAPSLGGLTAASTTSGATSAVATTQTGNQQGEAAGSQSDLPSIITVEVIGYGGGEGEDEEEEARKRRRIKHQNPNSALTSPSAATAQ